MSLAVSTTINTSKLSIRRRWARRTKPNRSMRVKLLRPSASTLPSPDPAEDFDDAAQLVLMETREASKRRLQGEIGEKLQKIKDRIQEIVRDYSEDSKSVTAEGDSEDPEQLFQSLTEPKARSAYYSHLNHCVTTCEMQCDELENILRHLHEAFTESQSGGTKKLLEQAEKDGIIDLEEATSVLGGALETAKASVSELVGIKGRMDRLMANLIEYPDTNKGRKKLEKALVQAEDELRSCLQSVEELQNKIKFHSEKNAKLQTQLEVKTKECTKLKESANEEVMQLRLSKSTLEKEIKSLRDSQAEAKALSKIQVPAVPAPVVSDSGKLKELKEALQSEKLKNQELEAQIRDLSEKHEMELETIKAEYEAESKEVRGRFEEQLKSLMEEDDIFQEVDGGDEDYVDATPVPESSAMESPGPIQPESSDSKDLAVAVQEPLPEDKQEMIQEEIEEAVVVERHVTFQESQPDEAELIHASQLEELKKQFSIKENQMKKQMEDNMNKYKSKTKSLQKQLAEAATSLMAKNEAEKVAKDLESSLKQRSEDLTKALNQNDELKRQLTAVEEENKSLNGKLQLKEEEVNKLTEKITNLMSKQAEEISLRQISPAPEVLSLQSSAVIQSQVQIPVRPESPVMMSESILPLVATEPALDELPDMLPSLEQSVISMDPAPLGSPLGSSPNDRDSMGPNSQHPVPYGLSMLAGSRLSHYSSAPQGGSISHSHPIMVEWVKGYDQVVKFKDGVITMLMEHGNNVPQLSGLIEELQAIDVHKVDKKADVQNQVVEMRFSLTLMLHQMEQTLQDSFGQLSQKLHNSFGSSTQTRTEQRSDGLQVKELKDKVCHLYNELAIAESHYIAQADAHKDIIAKLTTKNESLTMEVTKLKNKLSMQETVRVAMFSRIDMERNTRILREAANKHLLSEEEFQGVMEGMTEYLNIPASRLIALAYRLMSKDEVNKLVLNLTKTCTNARQAAHILEGIVFMDDKREDRHRSCMAQYRERRMELACTISDSLGMLEKRINTTLTKPFYGPPIPNCKGCIVPVNRAAPEKYSPASQNYNTNDGALASRAPTRSSAKTPLPQPASSQSQRRNISTTESIKQSRQELIQKLQQQNQQQQKEELSVKHRATTADTNFSRRGRTESRRTRHRANTAASKLHSSSVCNKSVQPLARTAPSTSYCSKYSTDDQMWDVKSTQQESYLDSKVSGYPFLPKIIEMDLPGNSFIAITHGKDFTSTTVKTDHQKSPSSSSLLHAPQFRSSRQAHPTPHIRPTDTGITLSSHQQGIPQTTSHGICTSALPPIHLPSAEPLPVAQ